MRTDNIRTDRPFMRGPFMRGPLMRRCGAWMLAAALPLFPAQAQSANDQSVNETPAFFSGQALLDICDKPNGGQCSMYVAGVVDGFFYLDRNESNPRFCQARINNVEAAQIVTKRLRGSSALRGIAAAAAVRIALRSKLACDAELP